MESATSLDPKDDQPPPRPVGVHDNEEQLPSYTKMMATLLDQVNKALDEKKVTHEKRYDAMVAEIQDHLEKVNSLQGELAQKLAELEKVEHSKITSESIHTGFDSSYVNKAKPGETRKEKETSVELLNPGAASTSASSSKSAPSTATDDDDDDDEIEASPAGCKFAQIQVDSYRESLAFLSEHPEILTERETDALLILAFNAQLEGKDAYARQCVHQALLLQYCRALGRDGVALFFKRITTPNHQARDIFYKDVQDTYGKIKVRTAEIKKQREAEGESGGVEQIQLHAVEPGTEIKIRVPADNAEDEEGKRAREIYDSFKPEMKKALESGSLDKVNKVLGDMSVEEAEELVNLFGEVST
jgi:cell division cycle protein 37